MVAFLLFLLLPSAATACCPVYSCAAVQHQAMCIEPAALPLNLIVVWCGAAYVATHAAVLITGMKHF
jgi:hypothetical protein